MRKNPNLPILSDETLRKSTAENNRKAESPLGSKFGYRTPLVTDLEPLPLPRFTKIVEPEDFPKVQLDTPLEELLALPETLPTGEISKWLEVNNYRTSRPSQYVGREANTMSEDGWESSDLRILVTRLSGYDSVNGSLTHGALSQISREGGEIDGYKVFVDHAYLPGSSADMKLFTENGIPWMYGRTTRRHPRDFDIVFMSIALTMEQWNVIPMLKNSGIEIFHTQRPQDIPLSDRSQSPIILLGGVVSDFTESLYGKVELGGKVEECLPDAVVIGDGEFTIHKVNRLLNSCIKEDKTRRDFLRAGHDLPDQEEFERDEREGENFSWFYQPIAYEHIFEKEAEPLNWEEVEVEKNSLREVVREETFSRQSHYTSLVNIIRKPEYEYAAPAGQIKRAIMRDLKGVRGFTEAPIQYDGSLGPIADVQISSGCLSGGSCSFCLDGDTQISVNGSKTISLKELESDPEQIIDTPWGLQIPSGVMYTGKQSCITLKTLRGHEITCTPEHQLLTHRDAKIQMVPACVAGTSWIETDWGFETIEDAFERLEEDATGAMVMTRHGLQGANRIVKTGVKTCWKLTFVSECGKYSSEVTCSGDHMFDTSVFGDGEPSWTKVSDMQEGQEVLACDPQMYKEFKGAGLMNLDGQSYYCTPHSMELAEIVPAGELECYDIENCDVGEYIVDGIICHNSTINPKDVLVVCSQVTNEKLNRQDAVRDFLYPAVTRPDAENNRLRLEAGHLVLAEGTEWETTLREPENLEALEEFQEWLSVLRKNKSYSDVVVSVTDAGERETYDIWDVEKGHSFYANGLVVSNCFTPDTPILMANGDYRYISEVEPSSLILTAKGNPLPIVRKYEREVDEDVVVFKTSLNPRKHVRVTKNHRFPVLKSDVNPEEATWEDFEDLEAKHFTAGTYLLGPNDGEVFSVECITECRLEPYKGKVYNLEVGEDPESEHSYRVATEMSDLFKTLYSEVSKLSEKDRDQIEGELGL